MGADPSGGTERGRARAAVQVSDPAAATAPAGEPAAGDDSEVEDGPATAADAAPTGEGNGQGLALAALLIGSLGLLAGLAALLFRRRPSA